MAKVPVTRASTAVAPWQDKLAQEAAEGAASESAGAEFVSFRGGILSFNGQAIPGNKMNVIVMDSAYEHAWYPNAFDANRPVSPSCYAYGRVESELAPAIEGDGVPENPQHTDCATCPLNEWGSDPDGGKGKACKNQRRLALIDAGVLAANNPDAIRAATVVFAKLPVTSGKNFSAFVIQIANVTKRPPYGVVAELSVVQDPRTQFQVKWQFVDLIPDGFIPAIMEKRAKMGEDILFTYPPNEELPQTPPAKTVAKLPPKPVKPTPTPGRKY